MPHVPTPMMSQRRRGVRLKSVHSRAAFYMPSVTHEQGTRGTERAAIVDHRPDGGSDDDVIDVVAEEVHTPELTTALPSPTPPDTADEAKWWQRWTAMGHGRIKKS